MSDKVIVGDGSAQRMAEWEAQYAHECAAVAEGWCPVHRTVLHPVEIRGGDEMVAGHCSLCSRYWFYDTKLAEVGWMLDHDPHTGVWVPPERPKRWPGWSPL
jgi:hypothetical protein